MRGAQTEPPRFDRTLTLSECVRCVPALTRYYKKSGPLKG